MPKAVITYDKDLPEIPDRQAHLPPTSYFRKREGVENEFEIVKRDPAVCSLSR
jgi:hypothetical protein